MIHINVLTQIYSIEIFQMGLSTISSLPIAKCNVHTDTIMRAEML